MRYKKVKLFDKKLNNDFFKILSAIGTVLALTLSFVEISSEFKSIIGVLFLTSIMIIYLILFYNANKRKSAKFKINNSTLEVKVGDIFSESDLKIIPFNEYFDTIVDDRIIAKRSLNGLYIEKYFKENVVELDKLISNHEDLEKTFISKEENRRYGKKKKYRLGSIVTNEEYILLAFSKFNERNKAKITIIDYVLCLLKMWEELNLVYAGRSISVPLLGSGITEIEGHCQITDHELLNIIIWTFEISRMKVAHPAKVNIIISENNKQNINFYNIRRW